MCCPSCVDGLLLLWFVARCVLFVGCCLLVMFVDVSCSWFLVRCLLLCVARCLWFVVCGIWGLFAVCCSLFVVRCLFLCWVSVAFKCMLSCLGSCCLLLIVCCWLFVVCCRLACLVCYL